MDVSPRDEQIFRMRKEGATLAEIARHFNLSCERVQGICLRAKERLDDNLRWPPLKRIPSLRARSVLMQVYGGESIFEEPEKIVVLGPPEFMKLKNVGRKKV